jgi:hypothetical protein
MSYHFPTSGPDILLVIMTDSLLDSQIQTAFPQLRVQWSCMAQGHSRFRLDTNVIRGINQFQAHLLLVVPAISLTMVWFLLLILLLL